MNDLVTSLASAFKGSSAASKATAALVASAVVLAIAVTAFVSNKPHYDMLLSGLNDNESAKVMKALSEAGVPFRVSQPPGPFVVYVDEGDRSAALAAAYGSGALDRPMKGIIADPGGMSGVFMSAGQREQIMDKRWWEEMEGVLEELDFVTSARVQTYEGERSPFASRADQTRTASVQLQLRNQLPLDREQAQTVALLVSHGLGIQPENLVISDQAGRTLHDGTEESSAEEGVRDWLEHKRTYDRATAEKANIVLKEILGANKARVTVDSLWNHDQSTKSSTTTARGTVLSETKNSTETPVPPGASPPAGAGTGLDFGGDNANVPDLTADAAQEPPAEPLVSTTEEEKTDYQPSVTREETVSIAPVLERLSVALFLDDSIETGQVADLEAAVKAAVGFDEGTRSDVFQTVSLPFVNDVPVDDSLDTGEPAATAPVGEKAPADEPSPMMELLLRRGVEIVTALVFVVLLLSSLRSARKSAARAKSEAASPETELDPELLAQAQVQELLTGDPERVGEILSSWAREEKVGTGG